MKASLLFDQDPQILELKTTVLPAGLPAGFAYQLLPPSAPPLLALLLAGTWLFSRAAWTQPEEALCQPGGRFSLVLELDGSSTLLCALPACQAQLPPACWWQPGWAVLELGLACWQTHQGCSSALPSCKHSLPPKGVWASSARKTQIKEKVNWERWSEGKAGEHAPCAEVLSPMSSINKQ